MWTKFYGEFVNELTEKLPYFIRILYGERNFIIYFKGLSGY